MEAFNEVRRYARKKRDKVITRARSEYADTLTRIAALEQDLLGRDPSTHRTIASCINSVLPGDRPFTTVDIVTALEALDPGRVWSKRTVTRYLSRLRGRGVVRRMRKSKATEPALYVRVGVEVERLPFEDKTLPEVVAEVLEGRSMTQTELAVAMVEAGYQTTMGPKSLRDAVGVVLRRDRRFAKRGRQWSVRAPQG